MQIDILTITSIVIGIVLLLFFIRKWMSEFARAQKPSEELMRWLQSTNQRLDEQGKAMNERLDNAARVIGSVQKNLGEMTEIGRGMKDLQEFLKSPKLRGNIGEHVLKELLGQMLPKQSFSLQHTFRSGSIVDAAITTEHGLIPIDAKFPMEQFRVMIETTDDTLRKDAGREFEKNVKKHIDDIGKKYILTDEGTIDYALMYVPSEAVFYEIVNNVSLFEYAAGKRVLPVSPATFYAYLRTILLSMEGQKIEKEAKLILVTIRAIQKDYVKVEENLGVLNRHLTNAFNQMQQVAGGFTLLGQKLSGASRLETQEKEVKQLEIEKE